MNDQKRAVYDLWKDPFVWVMGGLVFACIVLGVHLIGEYQQRFGGNGFPIAAAERVSGDKATQPKAEEQAKAIADTRTEMGQLGDYFGGTLNPIFGFVSVVALLITIVYQARELKLSTEELRNSATALIDQNASIEHQRFEQTFFAWMGTYRSMLTGLEDSISRLRHGNGVEREVTQIYGTRVLSRWMDLTGREISNRLSSVIPSTSWKEAADAVGDEEVRQILYLGKKGWGGRIAKVSQEVWSDTYRDNESQMGGLLRVLYRLLLWIDSQPLTNAQKWLYVSIIRAHLSQIEMIHLFFNGHSAFGATMKKLINKYALFDNLTLDKRPECVVMKETPPDGTGYAASAYDSTLARKAMNLPESAEETLALAARPHLSALE